MNEDWKRITVQFTMDVQATASPLEIEYMVGTAAVQFEEPQNEDGDRADFETVHVTSQWWEVN